MASPKVIAAAQAAASWARARRATWTDIPVPRPVTPASAAPRVHPIVQADAPPVVADAARVGADAPVRPTRPVLGWNSSADVETAHSFGSWIRRGAPAVVVVAAVAAAASYAYRTYNARRDARTSTNSSTRAPRSAVSAKTTGTLKVTSSPDGARVVVDGRDRGITPLSIDDVPPGIHSVVIVAKTGEVKRSVSIVAGSVAQLDEQIFDGWLAVFSPVEVVISDDDRVLRPDDRNEIMLAPGVHRLRFVNRALAFDDSRTVVVKPGERTALTLTPPRSTVTVTASERAEVFLDGAKIGDTPVSGVPAVIGTHELRLKRASGAERRMDITVTVKPFTVNVAF